MLLVTSPTTLPFLAVVTILLLGRYRTGNDSCLLRKRVLYFCTKREEDTISSDSTELAYLSLI